MKKFCLFTMVFLVVIPVMAGCRNRPKYMTDSPEFIESATPAETRTVTILKSKAPGKFKDLLEVHNRYRKQLGLPPLKWSIKLAKYAQNWADRLQSRGCDMKHRSDSNYGENLAWSTAPMSGSEVAGLWASERKNYNYQTNRCAPGKVCGHWTQMIWADSTHIGCAMASCGDSEVWVCNYDPPGNYIGRKPY